MSQGTNTGPEGQAPTTGTQEQGQAPAQGSAGQGQAPAEQQGQNGTPDLSAITDPNLRAWVEAQARETAEARQEAARYRNERNTFQTQITEAQRAAESDQERQAREAQERQERLDNLERENRTLKVGTAIQAAALEAKAFNPALIASMLDAKVALDDEGTPTNLQDLLKDLRQSDPYLFKRADTNAGEGQGQEAQPTGNMNDVIRGAFRARTGRTSS